MSDFADDAEATEELFRSAALKARKSSGPPAKGACYYCDAAVGPHLRWCDHECRDAWAHEQSRRAAAPKIELGE